MHRFFRAAMRIYSAHGFPWAFLCLGGSASAHNATPCPRDAPCQPPALGGRWGLRMDGARSPFSTAPTKAFQSSETAHSAPVAKIRCFHFLLIGKNFHNSNSKEKKGRFRHDRCTVCFSLNGTARKPSWQATIRCRCPGGRRGLVGKTRPVARTTGAAIGAGAADRRKRFPS